MKKKLVLIFISLLLISFCFNDGVWKFRKEQDGIKVYSTKVKGSKYEKSKAVASIKTDVNSLFNYLMTPINYKNFSPRIEKIKVIKKTSTYVIYYMSIDMPWPIYNRDGVYKVSVQSKTANEIVLTSKAQPNFIKKIDGYIRIQQANGYYKLKKNNDEVDVVYMVHSDPNGNVPAWVANYYLVDGPIANFVAMRKSLEK